MNCVPSIENSLAHSHARHYEPQGVAGDDFEDWWLKQLPETRAALSALWRMDEIYDRFCDVAEDNRL